MNNLKELIKKINIEGKICFNEPMSGHTTLKIGGPAEIFIEPSTIVDLEKLYSCCTREQIPWFVLGAGANILVADRGIRGVVISLARLNAIIIEGNLVRAGAGAAISDVALAAADRGLSGLEFIYAMPGSVGGAIYMNARCYDNEMADVLTTVEIISSEGRNSVPADKKAFGYKISPFQKQDAIITGGTFRLTPGDPARSRATMESIKKDREAKGHFLFPSAGSVFKNNRAFGKPTGVLLDNLGFKGCAVGDACVLEQHANIFVNKGGARAHEIYALMQLALEKIKAAYGYELESELILVGEWEQD